MKALEDYKYLSTNKRKRGYIKNAFQDTLKERKKQGPTKRKAKVKSVELKYVKMDD